MGAKLPRGMCPHCGFHAALRGGKVGRHFSGYEAGGPGILCAGIGQRPRAQRTTPAAPQGGTPEET